jgi:hypothetical protein
MANLDHVLGTRSQVRVLRALVRAREPMSVRELARRAGEHVRSAQLAVGRLMAQGLVDPTGTGRHRPVRFRTEHPLALALAALFQAEQARYTSVLRSLRGLVRTHAAHADGVWMTSDADTDRVTINVLASSGTVDQIVDALRDPAARLGAREGTLMELHAWTRPDLEATGWSPPPDATLLHGVMPAGAARKPLRRPRSAHEARDAALRSRAQAVADAIRRRPELIPDTRADVAQQLRDASPAAARTLREWQTLLDTLPETQLRGWLTDPGPHATRLRQSMPARLLAAAREQP